MPRYCLDLAAPAAGFLDSFLIGNGWLGATLRGGVGTERFDLNLDTAWSGGPLTREPGEGPAHLLAELRDAIRRRDYLRADELGVAMQGKRWTQSYQPLGAIELTYAGTVATGYTRRLDLANAFASTTYAGTRLESFVSNPDGVLVAVATGGSPDPRLAFAAAHPDTEVTLTEASGVQWLTATARLPTQVIPNYVRDPDPVRYPTDSPDADGTVTAGMGYAVVAALARDASGAVRLIASAASGFRGHDRRPSVDLPSLIAEAQERVTAALARSTADLQQSHRHDYRRLFDRVDLDLSASPDRGDAEPARAELLFHLGRYLLISSSRPGTQAANLQGIWNVDVRPSWSANYTININTEMNYWPAEPAALAELAEPLFTLTGEIATAGAETARRYFGAAGATAHHNTDLWRFTAPVPGRTQWSNWPSGLMWMAAHLEHHTAYGSASATARPALAAAAAFALDLLVAADDGALEMSPSTSPEHSFIVDGKPVAMGAGSAMDQELVRETLTNFIAVADAADPLAARARTALATLREPRIGAAGNLLEWDDDKTPHELGHRHLSHLYGLYPGIRITETRTPETFEAVRRALSMRLDNGTGYTGWSQAWVLCLAARLRDHDLAERSIAGLLGPLTSDGMLILHPHTDWPEGNVFQIDGNFGAVAGLIELVVQSHEECVALLKTLPPSWTTGHISGIRCRGGHTASVAWQDGHLTSADITAGTTGDLVLDLPAGTYVVAGADTSPTPAASGRIRVSWPATRGTSYAISVAR